MAATPKKVTDFVYKGSYVHFDYLREGIAWLKVLSQDDAKYYLFPVPVVELDYACMAKVDKAMIYMKWIRRALEQNTMEPAESINPQQRNLPEIDDNKLRDIAYSGIGDYLKAKGWKTDFAEDTMFYMIDPITKMPHRSDLAWMIQTEREHIASLPQKHAPIPDPASTPQLVQAT